MTCNICQHELVVAVADLQPVTGTDVGLAVRAEPKVAGRKLADYSCPYCEATTVSSSTRPLRNGSASTFIRRKPAARCVWNAANRCNARRGRRANTKAGHSKPPNVSPDYGLVCARCGATCCVACVKSATRNRTTDGSLLCPRCRRAPVDAYFYP
jgi:hypothetical protein